MKNDEYTNLLRETAKAMNHANALLEASKAEYFRRYGTMPDDADDDEFIDSLAGAAGRCDESITWKQVDDGAYNYAGLERYQENGALSGPTKEDE